MLLLLLVVVVVVEALPTTTSANINVRTHILYANTAQYISTETNPQSDTQTSPSNDGKDFKTLAK